MVEQQQLLPKPGTKCVVWDYFGLEQDKNGRAIDDGTVICRTCRRRVVAKHGNTSNLLSYLRTNHSRLYSQAKDAMKAPRETTSSCSSATSIGQPSLTECIEKGQKYDKKWKELTHHYINQQLSCLSCCSYHFQYYNHLLNNNHLPLNFVTIGHIIINKQRQ